MFNFTVFQNKMKEKKTVGMWFKLAVRGDAGQWSNEHSHKKLVQLITH